MATKFAIKEVPDGLSFDDFECFGPVVVKDTEFETCRMADMGCFLQEGVDSNKYYHASVVKAGSDWYLYTEWGKTKDGRSTSPNFQFVKCVSEQEAMKQFVAQCKKKNTSRGEWKKVGSIERFVPRTGSNGKPKDLYTIRVLASRAVGLPKAKNICNADAVSESTKKKASSKKSNRFDSKTVKLFQDLIGGAVSYTRSNMIGGTIPAQSSIDDARDLLTDAMKRVKKVGGKVENQVNDSELKQLTYTLYGMIPKTKKQGADESEWILSKENIFSWRQDLDAFETALQAGEVEEAQDESVLAGIPANIEWIDPKSDVGKWLVEWWTTASRNRHSHVGGAKFHNIWRIEREGDRRILEGSQKAILEEMSTNWNKERPLHQVTRKRPDLDKTERKVYWDSNTALMFHGTRSVNVPGIVRENFRFPKELVGVVTNGAAFGPGTYFADDWRKSAGYCSHPSAYWASGGGVKGRHSFMFAVDTICGHPHIALRSKGFTSPPKGYHSVFGKAGNTSYLANNEWIIYSKGRCMIKYLAELTW